MNYAKVISPIERIVEASELSFGVLRTNNIDPTVFKFIKTVAGIDHYNRIGGDT